jgi:hypothetical protein
MTFQSTASAPIERLLGAVVYTRYPQRGEIESQSRKNEFRAQRIGAETAFEVTAPDLVVVVKHSYEFVA